MDVSKGKVGMTQDDLAGAIEDLLHDLRLSSDVSRLSRTEQELADSTKETEADVTAALADLEEQGKIHKTDGGEWMSSTSNR